MFKIFIFIIGCTFLAQARETRILTGDWQYTGPDGAAGVVEVPHCWNAADAAYDVPNSAKDSKSVNSNFYKRGKGIYTRKLDLTPTPGKRYFVRCGGAGIITRVLINGREAGIHEGAMTAFCFEITGLLQASGNEITVEADNTYRDHIAPLRGDFSLFGGLYRPVSIIETDTVCIDPLFYASPGVFITPKAAGEGAEIGVKICLNNGAPREQQTTVKVELRDAAGLVIAAKETNTLLAAESQGETTLHFSPAKARRWNGREDPYLYTVRTTIIAADGSTDTIDQPCGIREAYIDPQKGFILNGKARQLRGVSRHQDKKGKGWALSPADEQQDIDLILDMGCDALRTAHYPQSTHIYDLCDKAGLIVWSEVSNVNIVKDTPEFRAHNRQFAREMVYQHWNHPSICLWGYFNEIGHQPEPGLSISQMADELAEMEQFIRALDPNRPTASVSNQPQARKLNNVPMHIGFNTYPGWYSPNPANMTRNIAGFLKNHGHKGVGISEYGHGASIDQHEQTPRQPHHNGIWHPEEWQSHAHEVNYAAIKAEPRIWGSFVWNMFDFGSSNRHEGGMKGINNKGLVTYDREVKKDAYWFYRANWSPQPTLYITSRRHTRRTSPTTPVKVYASAKMVELFVNGKSQGVRETDELHRAIWNDIKLQPGQNIIMALADGRADSCTWVLQNPAEL